MTAPHLVLAGGSGFLGQALARHFRHLGYHITILTRGQARTTPEATFLLWDGQSVGAWAKALEGATAIINLTGRSVSTRYTPEHRREIIASRVDSVRVLDQALQYSRVPPSLWIQAGSLAIYGDAGSRLCDESAPPGSGFPVETCIAWEDAFAATAFPQRKVLLRIGFVLDRDGGALEPLTNLTRLGLGGAAGNGEQYISWLHSADFNQLVAWCLTQSTATSIYNATGPNPTTNREFMRVLRRVLHRPWSPPIPAFAVHVGAWGMRTEADLVLKGRRCVPARLLADGFTFTYPDLQDALEQIAEGSVAK